MLEVCEGTLPSEMLTEALEHGRVAWQTRRKCTHPSYETLLSQHFRAKEPFGADSDDVLGTCLSITTGTSAIL